MTQQFFGLLTRIGENKQAAAQALNRLVQITELAVGDGGGATPNPDREQTALVNQKRRAPINSMRQDPANPNYLIVEQVIPEDVGGWYIRELGLYDADGDLVAVANCPETYKPVLAEGSAREQVVRLVLMVASTAAFVLKIDPAVVLATRKYVDDALVLKVDKTAVIDVPHGGTALDTLTPDYFLRGNGTDPVKLTKPDDLRLELAGSETKLGFLQLATTAEATAGSNDSHTMTPLKTRQATPGRLLHTYVYTIIGGLQQVSVDGAAFTSTNAFTFVPDAQMGYCEVETQGAGGGGAGAGNPGTGQIWCGAPGKVGTWAFSRFTRAQIGASKSVTVGIGGAIGVGSTNTWGSPGGTSSFGGLVTCPGGAGGAQGVLANPPYAIAQTGADPGVVTGSFLISSIAANNLPAFLMSANASSGTGGSSAGTRFGPPTLLNGANSNGVAAVTLGGGGGGVAILTGFGPANGGLGGNGIIIVKEYAA